ncbi:unnamed protein product, partial [Prorocentrum cordatum]
FALPLAAPVRDRRRLLGQPSGAPRTPAPGKIASGSWNLSTLNSAAHRNRSKAKLAVPMSAFPGAKTL